MRRDFRPNQDDADAYEFLLTRIASILAVRVEPLDTRMLSRYAIRASYARLVVGMSDEEAGTTLRSAFGHILDEQAPADVDIRVEVLLDLLQAYGGPGGSVMERILARSRTPTVVSGGGWGCW